MNSFGRAIGSLAAMCTVFTCAANAFAKVEPAIGHWSTPAAHGVVAITRCGGSICGRLIASDTMRANPHLRDSNNADPALRNRLVHGMLLLSGFHHTADGWDGGTIYNPEDGHTYKATITMTNPNTLDLKGCLVWPVCKTQTWHRTR